MKKINYLFFVLNLLFFLFLGNKFFLNNSDEKVDIKQIEIECKNYLERRLSLKELNRYNNVYVAELLDKTEAIESVTDLHNMIARECNKNNDNWDMGFSHIIGGEIQLPPGKILNDTMIFLNNYKNKILIYSISTRGKYQVRVEFLKTQEEN